MKIFRNILAIVLGFIIGSIVNMSLINLGHALIPIENVDVSDMDAYAAAIATLETKYFLFPFLGHAIGTLIGGLTAAMIAASARIKLSLVVGVIFLLGGITVNYMLTGPWWFTVLDLLLAYIPMALIGGSLGLYVLRKLKWL